MNRRFRGRPGRPPRRISVKSIRSLYSQGHSFRAIALATGVGYGTVRRAFHGQAPIGADTSGVQPEPPRKLKMTAGG
jgi:DNA invertase Pin-like site-specific DNA recombinase